MNPSSSFSIIVLIVGPAGSGKSTIADELAKYYKIKKIITTTSRSPRDGEINAIHYHFVCPQRFKEMIDNGEFIEWSFVHGEEGEHDRYYGVQKKDLYAALEGDGVLSLSVDIQGFIKLREIQNPKLQAALISFFVDASDETLMHRMEKRPGGMTLDERMRRIASAADERKKAKQFSFYRVNNENVSLAVTVKSVHDKIVNFRQHRLIEIECDR